MGEADKKEILLEIERLHQKMVDKNLADDLKWRAMNAKLDPMYEIFISVSGFNGVAVWILKFLAAVGAALVGLYGVIELFKRLLK